MSSFVTLAGMTVAIDARYVQEATRRIVEGWPLKAPTAYTATAIPQS